MDNSFKFAIFAKHPVYYQVPIFKGVHKRALDLGIDVMVFYGDDLSLRETYYKECGVKFKPDVSDMLDGYDYLFLRNYTYKSSSGFMSRVNPGLLWLLARRKYKIILVHGYETLTSIFALVVTKIVGGKFLWRGESTLRYRDSNSAFRIRLKRFLLNKYFSYCDIVFYSCDGNKDFLKWCGVDNKKLEFLPCAVDNKKYMDLAVKYNKIRTQERHNMGIYDEDCVLIFAARFTQRKRPMDLVKAVNKLEVRDNIFVLLVGDGPLRKEVVGYCQSNNIRFHWTGFVQPIDVSKYYSIADVYLVVSDYDPSPKALNEAMNFELPVIVSNSIGTARDLVKESNGFIINTGDLDQLSNCIGILANDNAKRLEMGAASRSLVQQYSIEADVDAIERVLNKFNHNT